MNNCLVGENINPGDWICIDRRDGMVYHFDAANPHRNQNPFTTPTAARLGETISFPSETERRILELIGDGEQSGPELKKHFNMSLVGFHWMMSGMEQSGVVVGKNRTAEVEGHPIIERWYKKTPARHGSVNLDPQEIEPA